MIFYTLLSGIGAVYLCFLMKVWSACGRYAHSSGSASTTWSDFLSGDLNELVQSTMGQKVLEEMLECLKQQNIK